MEVVKYYFEWFIEYMLMGLHFPAYVLNVFFRLNSVNKNPTQKHTIILVERWFRHNAFHGLGKWYLERAGFCVYTLNYSLAKGTFEDAAKNLDTFIKTRELKNVVLVGISAGAVTILTYLQEQSGWEHTYKFISIGGPLQGSRASKKFPLTKSIKQIIPESEFLKRLYSPGIKNKDKIYAIIAKQDNLVDKAHATIPGAHIINMDMVGHNLLHTFWIPTYKKIAEIARE